MNALRTLPARFVLFTLFLCQLGVLPVRAAADGLADIASWRQFHFGDSSNAGSGANTADPDGDGLANILEYALGLHPQAKSRSGLPTVEAGAGGLSLTYQRARADIDYLVESSSDLVNWSADGVDQGSAAIGEVIAVAGFGSSAPVVLRLKVYEAIDTVTGLRETGSDRLEFVVNTNGWADLHYRINSGDEVTVRMMQANGRNSYALAGLSAGDTVTYAYTYFADGSEVASDWQSYAFSGDSDAYTFTPLYTEATELEPANQVETEDALYTYFSDRARDRHAREDQFQDYDHYLSHYWEDRTIQVEVIDRVAKGGSSITFNVIAEWKLKDAQAELRGFYRGIGTVAEYYDNLSMTLLDYDESRDGPFFTHYANEVTEVTDGTRYYTRDFVYNQKEGRPMQVGDRLEIEISQFLDSPPRGRENYYGTTYLYIVGKGFVPWEVRGVFGDFSTEMEDSYAIDEAGWLGGETTLPYMYSAEPDNHFMQMATNLAPVNGQRFVLGRRLHHTDFEDGSHSESGNPSVDNPPLLTAVGKLGNRYTNRSCVACHDQNGRALPPEPGGLLDQYAIKVGDGLGNPHPQLGRILQPKAITGEPEGQAHLAGWSDVNGLRKPSYSFSVTPETFSARIAPQLVGMGLLEAIPEEAIAELADPEDADNDGITGRMHIVDDPETGEPRLGRFGWKAAQPSVRHQVASAFNTDMGVLNSVFPEADQGVEQGGAESGNELSVEELKQLTAYISLLGVRAQRDLDDPLVIQGQQLFAEAGCIDCHTPEFTTSAYHPHAELRNQIIRPYTDLLLHDMGPGLADNLGEGNATGSEWRTPPLWGIGLTAGVSGGEAYLHDGRARSLEEAILWHGGEGQAAKDHYEALSASEKEALLAFLRSL